MSLDDVPLSFTATVALVDFPLATTSLTDFVGEFGGEPVLGEFG
jgi:hypothetical protein